MEKPHYLWIDNFSKTLARSIPTMAKDVYSSNLWTGIAVFGSPSFVGVDNVRYANGDVVDAMPKDLFGTADSVTAALKYVHEENKLLFNESMVNRYRITNIPMKVDTKLYPHMKELISHPRNTLANVYPYKLVEHNIGSNIGLINVIRQIYDEYGMGDETCTRYVSLNLDENIYWRVLKVSQNIWLFMFVSMYEL